MTRGRAELLCILERTQAVFVAARCRVGVSAVYNWTAGRRRPSERARSYLRVNYGILPDSWDEEPVSTRARRG